MKKILLLVGSLLTYLIISLPIASADSHMSLALPDLLPQDIDLLYELNTNVDNPIEEWLAVTFNDLAEFPEEEAEKQLALGDLITDNHFAMAFNMDYEETDEYTFNQPQMYLSFEVADEDLEQTLALFESEYETVVYEENNVYLIMEDTIAIHIDGLFVLTTSQAQAEEMIDNYLYDDAETLANYQTYVDSNRYKTDKPFFNTYINPSFIVDEDYYDYELFQASMTYGLADIDPELMGALSAESVAVSQLEDGFELSMYVEGNKEKLEELDMMFDKYNFVPELYKDISGMDIIFFSEMNDLNNNINDTLVTFDQSADLTNMYTDFTDWFMEETSKDFNEDVLPLFTGRNVVAVHNTEQLYPAVTLLFDVNGNRSEATDLVEEVSDLLRDKWETQEHDEGSEFYIHRFTTIDGSDYYHHELDLVALGEDENLVDMPETATMFTITLGVSKDGILLISTHPELKNIYKSRYDMTDNKTFDGLFTNGESLAGLVYMDIDALSEYLQYVFELTGETEETIELTDKLLAPWHQLFMISYAEENLSWSLATLKAEIDGYEEYGEYLTELMFGSYDYDYDYDYDYEFPLEELSVIPGPSEFCDVNLDDWFSFYVEELSYNGIVSGYNDGCFRPGNDITRAEFTKMVVEATEMIDLFIPVTMSDQDIYFSDVPANEWYWHYINQASANGFVEGYEDGTFHPNDPISRAEAVQIIYNVYDAWNDYDESLQEANEPFTDVNESDWFYYAVNDAYTNNVVSGTSPTTFEPNRNITRAEAAKIIYGMIY